MSRLSPQINNVAVILVNWNTREDLGRCIDAFLAEGVPRRTIVVVDQDSQDGSATMVRKRFPGVTLLKGDNRGYGAAANQAARRARVDFLVIANADVLVRTGCVAALLDVFATSPKAGLLGPEIYTSELRRATRFSRTSVIRAAFLEMLPNGLRGRWRDLELMMHSGTRTRPVTYVEGALLGVRKEAFDEIGGFDEGLSFFFEDADLPLRMLKAGWDVLHVPAASAIHLGSRSFSKVPIRHSVEFYTNCIRFYRRHNLRKALLLRRLLLLVLLVKRWAFLILRKSDEVRRIAAVKSAVGNRRKETCPEKPLVSIIIPTFNRPTSVKRLLKALRSQTYKRTEVIIVNQHPRQNGPTGATRGGSVREILIERPNRALAKNIGATVARGDLLLFCDDDIIPGKDFVETHVRAHRVDSIAGVSCRVTEAALPDVTGDDICRITSYGRSIAGYQANVTRTVGTLVGANMSIKRKLFLEAGYFDSAFIGTAIFEEQDFSERLRSLGYSILFTNQTSVEHVPQLGGNLAERARDPVGYYRAFHHNEILYFLKNRNRFLQFAVIPFCFLRSVRQSLAYGLPVSAMLRMFSGVLSGWKSFRRYMG